MQKRKQIVQSVALAMVVMGPALAAENPQGFDATQISPLGDPAWVASLRGPDTSRPALNIGNIEATVPRSGTGEKDRLPDSNSRRSDSTVRNGQVLTNGRVYLIGAERSTLGKAGSILLAPGRAAELGDLRVPFVRVYVSAPAGSSLDVDRLVSQRPAIGMFNALFAPVPVRRGEAGETAIASANQPAAPAVTVAMKPEPAAADDRIAAAAAQLAVPPAIEERVVIARVVPIEDRSGDLQPIPAAMVEERGRLAFIVPVEDRSGLLAAIPAASVEEKSFIAFVAPIEERSSVSAAIPPAGVAERGFAAFVPVVEDRSGTLAAIPPAQVEERGFVAFVPVVEDRSMQLASIPPATVEERGFTAIAAPVVDRAFAAKPLVPAPSEERVPVRVAQVESAPVLVARADIAPSPALPAVVAEAAQVAAIGKPLPGASTQSELAAAKILAPADSPLVQVAVSVSAPVVVVAARTDMAASSGPAQAPVKLAAVQKRLPSVMIDRKGGFFFM